MFFTKYFFCYLCRLLLLALCILQLTLYFSAREEPSIYQKVKKRRLFLKSCALKIQTFLWCPLSPLLLRCFLPPPHTQFNSSALMFWFSKENNFYHLNRSVCFVTVMPDVQSVKS